MKHYLVALLVTVFLAACGDQADFDKETKQETKVTLSVTCEGNLESCGRMVMALASAGYPVGTTMTTTIDGISGTVFHANYGSAPTQQTYSLSNGSYRVTGTRVYPPATTHSVRSLVQVQTVPVDFTIAAPNTTKINITVAMLDADGDGRHDYTDTNSNNPCIPNNTVSACVNNNGGTVGTGVTGNDSDGDGCANSLDPQPTNPLVGCGGSPATTTTGVSYAWWTQAEASTWQCFPSCTATVVTDTTRKAWVVRMVVTNGLTMAHQQELYKDGGAITSGQSLNFSGKMQCSVTGTSYLEIENPSTFSTVSNLYYPVAVSAVAPSIFSANYTASQTISSKRSTIKVGLLSQSSGTTTCYFWHLKNQ